MAVDKLVDSSLLDAACTYEAGKIREKLGSSAQIAYDLANGKGFGDAIDAIQTGGGGLPSNMEVIDFTPISDLTSSNKLTLNFQNSYTSCFVCVYCLEQQSAPSSGYTALLWVTFYGAIEPGNAKGANAILRSNGTVGTDQYMCSFDESTLALSIGGQYGTFRAGIKYQAIKVNWGSAQ